jgi:hypothetical protein
MKNGYKLDQWKCSILWKHSMTDDSFIYYELLFFSNTHFMLLIMDLHAVIQRIIQLPFQKQVSYMADK